MNRTPIVGPMRLLWLTLADPDPPTNGQLIYSKGLIRSAAAAGAELHVIGLSRQEKDGSPEDAPGLRWTLYPRVAHSLAAKFLSPLPDVAIYAYSDQARAALDRALLRHDWDAIVFDSISGAWALEPVLHHCRLADRPPALVHIAHNHETTVARRIVGAASGLRRLYRGVDTLKVALLERRLVAVSRLVTSNTPEDVATFEAMKREPVLFLPPGYDGPRVEARTIDESVPRRAVLVGSYDWPPKRISLEKFLEVAAPRFAAARVDLQTVGTAAPHYIEGLRRRFPGVTFTGPVADVRPYMAAARVALVPDLLGGFKLKGLDYVFNRLPICAMRIALPAMPLVDGESVGHFDSHEALADGVIALIDDHATLNARHERAWAACIDAFDWPRLGRRLVDAIAKVPGHDLIPRSLVPILRDAASGRSSA